jgi:O-antigen/teichoic acid export membrane protein
VAGIIFMFVGPLLGLIYGEAYASAQLLLRILVIGMLAASLSYVIGDQVRELGGHSQVTGAESLGGIVGGVSLAALVPKSGVIGVATAVSLSCVATFIVVSMYAKRPGVRAVTTPGTHIRRRRARMGNSAFSSAAAGIAPRQGPLKMSLRK